MKNHMDIGYEGVERIIDAHGLACPPELADGLKEWLKEGRRQLTPYPEDDFIQCDPLLIMRAKDDEGFVYYLRIGSRY